MSTVAGEQIRAYWDEQATRLGTDPRATTQDFWMRQIEIREVANLLASLEGVHEVLDIGCGNGYGTLELAKRLTSCRFVGGDYSEPMTAQARTALAMAPTLQGRVCFERLDVRYLGRLGPQFDAVVSVRCLINLPEVEAQWSAIREIAQALKPGGHFILVENFLSGQQNLNAARAQLDLPPIEIRWHNRFFDDDQFEARIVRWFDILARRNISSSYYLTTRVVYSALCQHEGREPDYEHPIYEIATHLPETGNFGPIRLVHLRKR